MKFFVGASEEEIFKAYPLLMWEDDFDTILLYNGIYYTPKGQLVGIFDEPVNTNESRFICVVAETEMEKSRLQMAWNSLRSREDELTDACAILSEEEVDIIKGKKVRM